MTREIPLTRGLVALVDDEDFDELRQFSWYASPLMVNTHYARRAASYRGPAIVMHKLITGYALTDHIDGDGLNNQRSNLREASRSQNSRNRRVGRGGSSIYKGVSLIKGSGKWHVTYGYRPKRSAGYFKSEAEAGLAYDRAIRPLYGKEGTYNFPLPGERSALTGEIVATP